MKYVIIGNTHEVKGEPCLEWDCMTDGCPGAQSEAATAIAKTVSKAFGSILNTLPDGLYRFSCLEYSNDTDIETVISDSQHNKMILEEEQFDLNSPSLMLVSAEGVEQSSAGYPNMRVVACSEQELCSVQFVEALITEFYKVRK